MNTTYTNHSFYTLLAEPKAPMAKPWTSVLDYACVWASGQTDFSDATTKITESLYACGFDYAATGGGARYGSSAIFNLTHFLSEIGSSQYVNCMDMAKALTTFANSIGCNMSLTTFTSYSPIFPFPINMIDPIGATPPTNNTFSHEGTIWNDCRKGGFSFHAFSQNNDKATWDATLKYDIDENPDNVINIIDPPCGVTTTGYIWKLPCNEPEDIYIQRLIDDWTSGNNCYNRLDCGFFTYNREFKIY